MIKVLQAISDTYITNRIIRGVSQKYSNVGQAGSIDLFKIKSKVRNSDGDLETFIEYSRGLIKFDLTEAQRLIQDEKIDINHGSFWAKLSLKDAYAGQTTPRMFQVDVNRLRKHFDEGVGKDVVLYSDLDAGNFVSSSFDIGTSQFIEWSEEGCSSAQNDFYPESESQIFETGDEDLLIDVTDQLKEMIQTGENHGFRISLSDQNIGNDKNYFVKRFSSRHSYDELKRPSLVIGFDDSVVDTGSKTTLNTAARFVIRNYRNGDLSNIVDRSGAELTGSNCLSFRVSGSTGEPIDFPVGQVLFGELPQTGIYSSSITLTYDDVKDLISSGSPDPLKPGTYNLTGSWIHKTEDYELGKERVFQISTFQSEDTISNLHLDVSSVIMDEISHGDNHTVSVYLFDKNSIKISQRLFSKSPGNLQGIASEAHYRIREVITGETVIPFDVERGSTKLSADTEKLFFELDTGNLLKNRAYVIDILLKTQGKTVIFKDSSPQFKII